MADDKGDLGSLVRSQAEQLAARGDAWLVRELGLQVADRYAAAAKEMRANESYFAHVVRVLALVPGSDSLEQLLELLHEKPHCGQGSRLPLVASLLAEHRPVTELVEVVFDRPERDQLDGLRTCLFHELVLRGVDIAHFRPLRSWTHSRPSWDSLSWLPVHRSGMEANVDFPSRSIGGRSARGGTSALPTEGRVDPPTPRSSERSTLRDVATTGVHERIVSAVNAGEWGDCDGWVFLLDEALEPEEVPALLPTLPMRCVEGLGPTDRFQIAIRPVDQIWRMLFATASMGGMYSSGVHGAYGRLRAWHSIAALTGAPADASAQDVERYALESTWFHFEADAEWFHNDCGTDYGIAALSPDRRRLAVLAATDTD